VATLFSYCIPYDDGAAPNPYWGICTLVVCKPRIRQAATVGDWIVGTGSARSPMGNISGTVVYAMKVTQKMTMAEYDAYTAAQLPNKIPQWHHRDVRRRLGDSLYDFSTAAPTQRAGVHGFGNMARDLRGHYALLSDHFIYFGDKPEGTTPFKREGGERMTEGGSLRHARQSRGRYPRSGEQTPWTRRPNSARRSTASTGASGGRATCASIAIGRGAIAATPVGVRSARRPGRRTFGCARRPWW